MTCVAFSFGVVDGADFLELQRGFGTIYDATDLADWEANYGAVASLAETSTAVREPSSMFLMLATTQILFLRVTRRGDRSQQLVNA